MRSAISTVGSSQTPPGQWEPPLPEELAPLMTGYDILDVLGRGGMGAVYKGIQKNLDRLVAIKLLPPELGENPEFEARFKREAKSMAQLNHPNIVQIYDFGQTSEGHYFFVMEFVEGTDLHQFIRAGGLEAEGALNAVSQICDALQYAHEMGYVHRDIKPANIFLNQAGVLKVGDFGLAKLVEGDDAASATEQMGLTMTGVAMGTPHYIAPEQLEEGIVVDHRADIYSLGVMFYEMLTGELPRGAVRDPSQSVKSLDVRVDGVVFKAMESNREERYQTASDLRTDVDVIRSSGGGLEREENAEKKPTKNPKSHTAAPEKQKTNPSLIAAAVVLPLLLIGGLLWWMNERKERAGNETALAETPSRRDIPVLQSGSENSADEGSDERTPSPRLRITAELDDEKVTFYNTTRGGRDLPTTDDPMKATKQMPYENSLGMRFVPVPIVGGASDGQRVLFSIWETRVRDYQRFVEATKSRRTEPDFEQRAQHPAVRVSLLDAQSFCSWLNSREPFAQKAWCLPTDHEWSCAVGIGHTEKATLRIAEKSEIAIQNGWPWGENFPPENFATNLAGQEYRNNPNPRTSDVKPIPNFEDGFDRTSPVGTFVSNEFGLFDLGGNVSEWVNGRVLDGRFVVRGGAWNKCNSKALLSAHRSPYESDTRNGVHGFRVVFAPKATTQTKEGLSGIPTGSEALDPGSATIIKDKTVPSGPFHFYTSTEGKTAEKVSLAAPLETLSNAAFCHIGSKTFQVVTASGQLLIQPPPKGTNIPITGVRVQAPFTGLASIKSNGQFLPIGAFETNAFAANTRVRLYDSQHRFAAAVFEDGSVRVFNKDKNAPSDTPQPEKGEVENVIQVSATNFGVAFLKSDGTVYFYWGREKIISRHRWEEIHETIFDY